MDGVVPLFLEFPFVAGVSFGPRAWTVSLSFFVEISGVVVGVFSQESL